MENFETAFQCLILDFETLRGKVKAFKLADFCQSHRMQCNAGQDGDKANHEANHDDVVEKDDGAFGKGDVLSRKPTLSNFCHFS